GLVSQNDRSRGGSWLLGGGGLLRGRRLAWAPPRDRCRSVRRSSRPRSSQDRSPRGAAELECVGPADRIGLVVEAHEPSRLTPRQEQREAQMALVRPELAADSPVRVDEGDRQVVGSFERAEPVPRAVQTNAQEPRDPMEQEQLPRPLPGLPEEAPPIPVLRGLDDPALVAVAVDPSAP